ncbi:MAG: DNA-directed RNA polymerase subunit alpha [Gemmatimonadetes bacterium]|nr:DNA-directed RNA polymerase subunit alpha [Gemmatimonadota bacterium]MYI07344.1 DNA-directed RNA polymerase subunit alpha [Gemmatimonadota bacterium]
MNLDIDLAGLVLPERIEITGVSEDGRSADFVLEPLERGYGHTLGNSVRRVLLSSLRGSAVWAFRISSVVHEHQTIPSVVEDVHQVIQNLKSLVLSLDDDVSEAVLEIRVEKAGPVTAVEIRGPGSVTIHNPDHHILTLEDDLELNIELYVNKGRGFVLADQHPVSKEAPVDQVRIDAIYNPVLRSNFTVEETRVGQRTDFDRLTIHVETDGSVDPESAIEYAAELVRKHLEYMLYFAEGGPPEVESTEPDPMSEKMEVLLETSIDDLVELSSRSRNSLRKKAIHNLRDLIARTEAEMLEIENFGQKSLSEMNGFLSPHGLNFGTETRRRRDGRLFFVEEEAPAGAGE